MKTITSNNNPLIKEVRALKTRKHRDKKGLFLIEGEKIIKEAMQEEVQIEKILVSEKHKKTKLLEFVLSDNAVIISDKLFKEISDTETPQGIMAIIKTKKRTVDDILKTNNHIVILDCVQDPGNMGTIIRTADAAGFSGIIVSKNCVDVYSPKVIRATMGSIFRIPVCDEADIEDSISKLKSKEIKIYASHLQGECSIYQIDMTQNIAIVIGNESQGISREVALKADALVKIPMLGKSESLNASIAAGILMYESLRQRLAISP